MEQGYADYGDYEALDYGKWGLVFWRGQEWATFSVPNETPFETAFEIWLDESNIPVIR